MDVVNCRHNACSFIQSLSVSQSVSATHVLGCGS